MTARYASPLNILFSSARFAQRNVYIIIRNNTFGSEYIGATGCVRVLVFCDSMYFMLRMQLRVLV